MWSHGQSRQHLHLIKTLHAWNILFTAEKSGLQTHTFRRARKQFGDHAEKFVHVTLRRVQKLVDEPGKAAKRISVALVGELPKQPSKYSSIRPACIFNGAGKPRGLLIVAL